MGLLSFIFGKDVTRDWVANRGLRLGFDLGRRTLCDVAIDGRIERLEGLGPAENRRAARSGKLHYYSKGLRIEIHDGLFDGFTIYWDEPGYQPWPGLFFYEGSPIPLDDITPEKLIELVGEPDEHEDDEVGTSLEFFRDDGWCDIQFDMEGRLKAIYFS